MSILQDIFTDYYEEIKYNLHPRDCELDNIDKMINCGDPSFGGTMYAWPSLWESKIYSFPLPLPFLPFLWNEICYGPYSQNGFQTGLHQAPALCLHHR